MLVPTSEGQNIISFQILDYRKYLRKILGRYLTVFDLIGKSNLGSPLNFFTIEEQIRAYN